MDAYHCTHPATAGSGRTAGGGGARRRAVLDRAVVNRARVDLDLGLFGTLTPFAQLYGSDEVFFRPTNEALDQQSSYWLLNFRLMWQSENDHFAIAGFVDNALDEDVATTKIVGSALLGAPLLNAFDRPRTAGISLRLNW